MKISIPEPCHEDWNLMAPVDFNHRHCAACDRTLTDFSGMTDAEVGTYLRRNPGKLCGRFAATQLDRKLALGGPRSFGGARAAAAAAGLLLAVPATGQSVAPVKTEQQATSFTGKAAAPPAGSTLITGTVTDEEGTRLPFVSVSCEESGVGTVADIDGNYSLTIQNDQELTLVFQYTGFNELRVKKTFTETSQRLDTTMEFGDSLTGIVVVYVRRSLPHRIFVAPVRRYVIWPVKKAVRGIGDWRAERFERHAARQLLREERRASRLAEQPIDERADMAPGQVFSSEQPELVPAEQLGFKASPNPFNDFVRVEFVLPERQAYRLQLISATGQTIGEWKQTGEKGRQEVIIDHQLAGLPAGTYLLELNTRTTSAVLLLVR